MAIKHATFEEVKIYFDAELTKYGKVCSKAMTKEFELKQGKHTTNVLPEVLKVVAQEQNSKGFVYANFQYVPVEVYEAAKEKLLNSGYRGYF